MDFLLVILIIIIVLSVLYLYYRNKQYNNVLESFINNNNSQSSLSTYFQDTVDYDSYATNKNLYHANELKIDVASTLWDGLWVNDNLNIYAQFIQQNDKLIIALSNSSFDQIQPYVNNITDNKSNGSISCYVNSFVGIGKLTNDLLKFNLIEVYCDNYINNDLNLSVNNFAGVINTGKDQTVNLYSVGKGQVIPLTLKSRFSYYNKYAKSVAPNTNTYPSIPDSNFEYKEAPCIDSEPCYDKTHGIALTSYNNAKFNACGKALKDSDKTCDGKPSCVFYSPAPDGMQSCVFTKNVYDYMNFPPLSVQTEYKSNSLLLCKYLNNFSPGFCNSCIICYITDIGNVYSLNYQFFGVLPGESSLTVQSDIMDHILNNESSDKLLPFYRNSIKNNTNQTDLSNAVSFTNCIENSNIIFYNDQLISCTKICNKYISNYKGPIGNRSLLPCIWQINMFPTKNILNSCPVILSTSQNYNAPYKYAEFGNDGTTSLSLYSGGTKQQLLFEKVNILKENSDSKPFIAMTANIRTNSGFYLVPSTDNSGFNNKSNVLRSVNKPHSNGKWLIIGFVLNNLNNLDNTINNFSF